MKSKRLWLGMLVVVLAFGMTVVGCGDADSTNNGDNDKDKGTVYTFPEEFLGGYWRKDGEPGYWLEFINYPNGNGFLNAHYLSGGTTLLLNVQGNVYTVQSHTTNGNDYTFTALIGIDGKLIISNSDLVPYLVGGTTNGIYTKNAY